MSKKSRIPKPSTKTLNPLAKAMEKISKPHQISQPQSWYDEKVESVSQKQQHQTSTEHERRKEELFSQLKKTESELVMMQELLDEREKRIKEALEESSTAEPREEQSSEDKEEIEEKGDEEQPEKPEKITKKSMKNMRERMQEMKEKLQKMNRDTDIYLSDVENTVQFLDSLKVASDKLGPLSFETRQLFDGADDEEIIAQIYKENRQQLSENKNEEDLAEDELDEEKEVEKDIRKASYEDESTNAVKVFVTEKTVTCINYAYNDTDGDSDKS